MHDASRPLLILLLTAITGITLLFYLFALLALLWLALLLLDLALMVALLRFGLAGVMRAPLRAPEPALSEVGAPQ